LPDSNKSSRAAIKKQRDETSLTNSGTCSWGGGREEGGDWSVYWRAEDSREQEVLEVAWLVISDNQPVGLNLGTRIVFQVGELRFRVWQEHVFLEQALDGCRSRVMGMKQEVQIAPFL
jgi:hypothetical protein